nr:auxin-induced protein 6B-like [Ipomoea batatas]GMC50344.1 auxin-induced protein 6B-like [Ipomoea batatas]
MSACSKIRHIVRLRQMLRRWRKKAARGRVPADVPTGHVAVTVGSSCKRFVVRATYLNHPVFVKLLSQAEEEYGFTNAGPLTIPCDESLFEEALRYVARPQSNAGSARCVNLTELQRYCSVGLRNNLEIWTESRPLLHGVSDKSDQRCIQCCGGPNERHRIHGTVVWG